MSKIYKWMLHRAQDKKDRSYCSEVDVRLVYGANGEPIVVLQHDHEPIFNHTLQSWWRELPQKKLVALNVKEDGMMDGAMKYIKKNLPEAKGKFFFFDMSIPQLVHALKKKYPVAFRISDLENYYGTMELIERLPDKLRPKNIRFWLDDFFGDEDEMFSNIAKCLEDYPDCQIFVVAPEVHGRIASTKFRVKIAKYRKQVIVCQDRPYFKY